MYIPSGKYSNFKEEILEYPTMTKRLYRKLETKVREYMMNSNRTMFNISLNPIFILIRRILLFLIKNHLIIFISLKYY